MYLFTTVPVDQQAPDLIILQKYKFPLPAREFLIFYYLII
jgi:hypothetical protein